jgi:hypothetical protein
MSNLGEDDSAYAAGALYIMSLKLLSFEELIRFLNTMFNVCTCHHLTTLSATMSNLGEEDAADAAGALYIMSLKLLSFEELIRFLNTMFNVCTCHHLTTLSATMSNLGEEDAADAAGALYIMSLKLLSFEELIRFLNTMFNVCFLKRLFYTKKQ